MGDIEISMKKRKDECQFCTSRSCYHQIFRDEEPRYDEVYCSKHIEEATQKCDEILGGRGSGIIRTHVSGTSKKKRGQR